MLSVSASTPATFGYRMRVKSNDVYLDSSGVDFTIASIFKVVYEAQHRCLNSEVNEVGQVLLEDVHFSIHRSKNILMLDVWSALP